VPAINRASMTISITGEPAGDFFASDDARLDLATDEAKAFLLALHDGGSPVAADSRSGFQFEFAIKEDGPAFIVSGAGTTRRFNVAGSADVKTMAAHLLADLGP